MKCPECGGKVTYQGCWGRGSIECTTPSCKNYKAPKSLGTPKFDGAPRLQVREDLAVNHLCDTETCPACSRDVKIRPKGHTVCACGLSIGLDSRIRALGIGRVAQLGVSKWNWETAPRVVFINAPAHGGTLWGHKTQANHIVIDPRNSGVRIHDWFVDSLQVFREKIRLHPTHAIFTRYGRLWNQNGGTDKEEHILRVFGYLQLWFRCDPKVKEIFL